MRAEEQRCSAPTRLVKVVRCKLELFQAIDLKRPHSVTGKSVNLVQDILFQVETPIFCFKLATQLNSACFRLSIQLACRANLSKLSVLLRMEKAHLLLVEILSLADRLLPQLGMTCFTMKAACYPSPIHPAS